VDQRHAAYGREDPSTLKARCQLAQVLAQQGNAMQLRQAEAHLQEVFTRRELNLGRNHPDTLSVLMRIAFLLEETQPEEAEQLHEEVWQRIDDVAPVERRRSRSRPGGFMLTLEEMGEPDRAEAMMRQVATRRSAALGASHPDSLVARSELARVLARRGDKDAISEALELRKEVAQIAEATLGPDHVDTLAAKVAVAGALIRGGVLCGDMDAARLEAEAIQQDVSHRLHVAIAKAFSSNSIACTPSPASPAKSGSPGRHAVLFS